MVDDTNTMEEQNNVSWNNIMDTVDGDATRDVPKQHQQQQRTGRPGSKIVELSPVAKRLFAPGGVTAMGTPIPAMRIQPPPPPTPPPTSAESSGGGMGMPGTGTPVPPVPPVLVPPPILPPHQQDEGDDEEDEGLLLDSLLDSPLSGVGTGGTGVGPRVVSNSSLGSMQEDQNKNNNNSINHNYTDSRRTIPITTTAPGGGSMDPDGAIVSPGGTTRRPFMRVNMAGALEDSNEVASKSTVSSDGSPARYKYLHEQALGGGGDAASSGVSSTSSSPFRPQRQPHPANEEQAGGGRKLVLKKWKESDDESSPARGRSPGPRDLQGSNVNKNHGNNGNDNDGPHQTIVIPTVNRVNHNNNSNYMAGVSGHSVGTKSRISDLTMNTSGGGGDGGSSLEFGSATRSSGVSDPQQHQQQQQQLSRQQQYQEALARYSSGGSSSNDNRNNTTMTMPSIVENSMNSGFGGSAAPPESAAAAGASSSAASMASSKATRFSEQLSTSIPDPPKPAPSPTPPEPISKEDEEAGMATTLNALKNLKTGGGGGDSSNNKKKKAKDEGFFNRDRIIYFFDHLPVCLGPTLVLAIIAVIVVKSMGGGGGGDDGSSPSVAPSPTLPPTMAPTSTDLSRHESQLFEFINEMIASPQSPYSSVLDTSTWIRNRSSPQFLAFSWLLYDPLFESFLRDEQDRRLEDDTDLSLTSNSNSSVMSPVSTIQEGHLQQSVLRSRRTQRASSSINLVSFLSSYQRTIVMQRFAMATLYYSTDGDNWEKNSNWLSELPVCSWYVNNFGRQCLTSTNNYKGDVGDRDVGDFITQLELDGNQLRGTIPNELVIMSETLHTLILSNNSISGPLPAFLLGSKLNDGRNDPRDYPGLGYGYSLKTLYLDNNKLTGPIPAEWVGDGDAITKLEELKLNNNRLSGTIPPEFWVKALSLVEFRIGGNPHLKGSISTEIGNLNSLRIFHGEHVGWTGTLPTEIGTCFQLRELNLNQYDPEDTFDTAAKLQGSIPSEVWELPRLRLLDLEGLDLVGRLPTVGQLVFLTATLREIRIGYNQLQGSISTMFGLLTNLQTLEVQHNQLGNQGGINAAIPTELGSLTMLKTLDLSKNQFASTLPTELAKLTKLGASPFGFG